jgi:hypothetical protein
MIHADHSVASLSGSEKEVAGAGQLRAFAASDHRRDEPFAGSDETPGPSASSVEAGTGRPHLKIWTTLCNGRRHIGHDEKPFRYV